MLLHITVHLISNAGHSKHFTPVLWLTVQGSLQSGDEFKVTTLKFEVRCRTAPTYLRDLLPPLWSQPPMTATFLQTVNLPAKQARCSWEEEMTFGGAGYGLWTFFPEERKINSLANFSVNLIFPAEHPSITSSNKAKFYKIIKFFLWQAETEGSASYRKTHSHTHTHTLLLVTESVLILKCMRVRTQEHTETKQHSYSDISGTGLGDVLHCIKYVMKCSHRYLMFLPVGLYVLPKELVSWYTV